MTWSLQVANGDLVKGKGNALQQIRGPEKVAQDVRASITEPYGSDPLNPTFGTFIDLPQGNFVEFQDNDDMVFSTEDYPTLIIDEVNRILENYQAAQLLRLKAEIDFYNGKHTFDENELVDSWEVSAEQVADDMAQR